MRSARGLWTARFCRTTTALRNTRATIRNLVLVLVWTPIPERRKWPRIARWNCEIGSATTFGAGTTELRPNPRKGHPFSGLTPLDRRRCLSPTLTLKQTQGLAATAADPGEPPNREHPFSDGVVVLPPPLGHLTEEPTGRSHHRRHTPPPTKTLRGWPCCRGGGPPARMLAGELSARTPRRHEHERPRPHARTPTRTRANALVRPCPGQTARRAARKPPHARTRTTPTRQTTPLRPASRDGPGGAPEWGEVKSGAPPSPEQPFSDGVV